MDSLNPRVTSVRKTRLGADSDRADREFWAALTPDERVLETWRLSLELWSFKDGIPVNPDFVALLRELSAAEARFLVVGAYALARHARPRATGDLDLWVDPTPANASRVHQALRAFGAPLAELSEADLTEPDLVFQIGVAPRRIDIMTSLTGIAFAEAWDSRVPGRIGDADCSFLGREQLIRNKRALGRPRDLADIEALGE